jgi:hypothetical protein
LKQPSILDVVHGVKVVAPAHPEVTAWWYTPPQRLRLAGELPVRGDGLLAIELVVETTTATASTCERIARELSTALRGAAVGVRLHRGSLEERPLFRVMSAAGTRSPGEAPHPA